MNKRQGTVPGSCLCGAVRFELTLPCRFCAHCHCANCGRAHGAEFVTWAGFKDEQFRIVEGEATLGRYLTDTGATRSFCSRCGTTLLYQSPRWAGEVHVALRNIDGPIDKKPAARVYVDSRPDWSEITDDLAQYGGTTGMERKHVVRRSAPATRESKKKK